MIERPSPPSPDRVPSYADMVWLSSPECEALAGRRHRLACVVTATVGLLLCAAGVWLVAGGVS